MALPFFNWSRTAASNATADSTVNWSEGQAPSSVNDSARAMMASTAAYRDDVAGANITAGISTAYTLTSYQVFDTLAHLNGAMIAFTPHATNGASPTLNVDGLGAKSIVAPSGSAIAAGTLVANSPYVVVYNSASTEFRVVGVVGTVATTPSQNYLTGLTLSTAGSSATFGIATGAAADSTNASLLTLASAYTKTTSSWALGTAAGALDTGAIAPSTWYHVHLIKRIDTGVVDALISTSASAPTMPTSYTLFRRIGSIKTNASSQWTLFVQLGDDFLWAVPAADISTAAQSSIAALYTLSVPTGVQVSARLRGSVTDAMVVGILLSSPDETSGAVNSPIGNGTTQTQAGLATWFGELSIRTNTSAQIRAIASASIATFSAVTFGWSDRRGK